MKIETGAVLVIETGEYSDYSFTGPFRVLKAFDQAEIVEAYAAETPKQEWSDKPDLEPFIPWLVKHGYIEDVPGVVSWHVGGYGRFEPEIQ